MLDETTCSCIKIGLLLIIIFLLMGIYSGGSQGYDNPTGIGSTTILDPVTGVQIAGPSWGASDKVNMTGDMPTVGYRQGFAQNFNSQPPAYFPMADEAYLSKYLYGFDPSGMTTAAKTSVATPVAGRLNVPGTGAYSQYGESGVSQATNDYLTMLNLGGGTCASGNYVLDTSTCPENIAPLMPGPEAFRQNYARMPQNGLYPN